MTRRYVEIVEPMRRESAERMNSVLRAARAVGGADLYQAAPTASTRAAKSHESLTSGVVRIGVRSPPARV